MFHEDAGTMCSRKAYGDGVRAFLFYIVGQFVL